MNDQHGKYARLRHTATGAIAALAAVGAIAGTAALAASPPAKTHTRAADAATGSGASPFLSDAMRLVRSGTLSAAQGQVLERQIHGGRLDLQALAAAGFTPAQLQAIQQALSATKRALAASAGPGNGAKPPAGSAPPACPA